jgi:O-glycosyl hydrolase
MIKTLFIAASLLIISHCSKKNDADLSSVSLQTFHIAPSLTYQEMDGFGASDAWRCQFVGKNWPLAKREKIADLLFSQENDENGNPKGIGLSIWRFNIGAGSMEQGAESNIGDVWRRAECFLNADGTYDWAKQAGQQWFLQAAKKRGVEKLLAFNNSIPVFFTQNAKAYSPGGWKANLKSGYMSQYADFLADVAEHFKNIGLNFDYLSPFNEPQWEWIAKSGLASQEGTPCSNTQIAELSRLLAEKLKAKSLKTRITIAEAAKVDFLYKTDDANRGNQIESFFSAASPNYLAPHDNIARLISGHSYFSVWPLSQLQASRQELWSKIQATDKSLKYWQSEYCILETAGTDMSGGNGRDLGMKTALYVARLIYYDLALANASSWQWWTALTRVDYKDGLVYLDNGDSTGMKKTDENYCLNDGEIRESKLLWALGNFSRFVRPGMKRVKIFSSTENKLDGLMSLAFINEADKQLVVVFINKGTEAKNIKLQLENYRFSVQTMKTYETSVNNNLKMTGLSKVSDIKIPAQSIITLTGSYN